MFNSGLTGSSLCIILPESTGSITVAYSYQSCLFQTSFYILLNLLIPLCTDVASYAVV